MTTKINTHDKEIKLAISKSEDNIENAIIGINNHITEQGSTIEEKIDGNGCVKSVQHLSTTVYSSNESRDLAITTVNPNKTIVLVTAGGFPETGYIPCPYGYATSSTNIHVGASYIARSSGVTPSYECALQIQVIEFY